GRGARGARREDRPPPGGRVDHRLQRLAGHLEVAHPDRPEIRVHPKPAGLLAGAVPELVAARLPAILRERELDGGSGRDLRQPLAAAWRLEPDGGGSGGQRGTGEVELDGVRVTVQPPYFAQPDRAGLPAEGQLPGLVRGRDDVDVLRHIRRPPSLRAARSTPAVKGR